MLIAMATSILRKSGQIYVLGDNRSGIRTVKRHLEMSVAPIEASFSGKHCIMYRITPLKSTKPFCWWAWETMYETTVQKEILTIIGYPGVFSATHLDEGTQLLLENLQVHPGSTLLDLGCGTGVVGAYCARQEGTAQIMMADSDRFALAAAQRTAEANQLTNVTIQPSDGFSRIGDTYDHIICNPPFHQGRRLDHHLSIATAWFRDAARYLRKDGRITVCGNIFLPLGKLLKNTFRNVKTVAENRQYAIWEGSNPDSN
jgi:16S rRNA (guanine1207-N2)-methyltransferase